MIHTRLSVIASVAILLAALSACSKEEPQSAAPKSKPQVSSATAPTKSNPATFEVTAANQPDAVLARVNGKAITQKDVDDVVNTQIQKQMAQMYAKIQMQGGKAPAQMPDDSQMRKMLEPQALDMLIRQRVLEPVLAKEEQAVDPARVEKELADLSNAVEKQQGVPLKELVEKSGETMDEVKKDLRKQVALENIVERLSSPITVKEEDVKNFFETNKEQYGQEEALQASHILLGYKGNPNDPSFKPAEEEKKELKAKAEAALKRVKGGEDFAVVAKELSSCPSAARGGDLGSNPKGRMVPEFDEAAWKLKEGEISGVVETKFGFHVIKAGARKPEKKADFDAEKAGIKRILRGQELQKRFGPVMEKLRAEAKVEELAKKPDAAPGMAPSSAPARAPAATQAKTITVPAGKAPASAPAAGGR